MSTIKSLLAAASMLVVLGGCGLDGKSTVRGRVTDQAGAQTQEARKSGDTYGGSGTVTETSKVQLSRIGSGGALEVVATATVSADGKYELQAPAGEKKLIAQAFDASGKAVASAIVESTGEPGQAVVVTPMDTESSVEAEVLAEMVAQGVSPAEANAIDLRARINAKVAAEVRNVATSGGDAKAKVRALAEATIGAQRTQLRSYAQNGVNTTQAALFDAQLQAAQQLDLALDSGSKSSSQAYADFFAAIDQAAESSGADAGERAQAESCASASFRATISARSRSLGSPDAVANAAILAAASLEARSSAVAVEAILRSASAAQAVMTSTTTVGTELRQQVSAATSASAATTAFATFRTSVTGGADVSSSVLGSFLAVDASSKASAQAAVDASVSAAATFNTTVSSALALALETTGLIDFNAMAGSVVSAYTTYSNSVKAQASSLSAFGSKAQPTVDVLLVVEGSMRVGG